MKCKLLITISLTGTSIRLPSKQVTQISSQRDWRGVVLSVGTPGPGQFRPTRLGGSSLLPLVASTDTTKKSQVLSWHENRRRKTIRQFSGREW
jgi:hypothetical protein